jgi:hypothetical protein
MKTGTEKSSWMVPLSGDDREWIRRHTHGWRWFYCGKQKVPLKNPPFQKSFRNEIRVVRY